MSLLKFNFESQYLNGNTDVNIILPDKPREIEPKDFYTKEKKYKVLWLLHGTYGDYSDWIRKSNIELYACERNLVVVMPSGMNSEYSAWPKFSIGYDAYKYVLDELMPVVYNWLPVSDKHEDNFIAGLSMGGWGACTYAFNHPEKFAGMAALSGVPCDVRKIIKNNINMDKERFATDIENAGGLDSYLKSPSNIWGLAEKIAKDKESLKMYFACGDKDKIMYKQYCIFKNYASSINLNATFEEGSGFQHEWRFWDIYIEKVLDFFDIKINKIGGNIF